MNFKLRTLYRSCLLIFQIILAASWFTIAQAASESLAPEKLEGTTTVSAEDVFRLVNEEKNLVMIDARMQEGRTKWGYIEGSVLLPDVYTTCDSIARLVKKKTDPVMFYCNGVTCGRSEKSAKIAHKCGYQKIYWFRGGIDEWKEKKYPYLKN